MDPQTKLDTIKYKIRSFSLKYSKNLAKEKQEKTQLLENIVEQYKNLSNSELNVTKGQILRSKSTGMNMVKKIAIFS